MKKLILLLFGIALWFVGNSQTEDYEIIAWELLEAKEAFVIASDTLYTTTQVDVNDTILVTKDWVIDSLKSSSYDYIDYSLDVTPYPDYKEGRITWNNEEYTIDVHTGIDGVVLQVNQEDIQWIWNGGGDTIYDGRAVTSNGIITQGLSNVVYASSYNHVLISNEVFVTTMDIPPGEIGGIVSWGKVRGESTPGIDEGKIYLNDANPADGKFTNIAPVFPSYVVPVGGKLTDSTIFVSPDSDPYNTLLNAWNGTIREPFTFFVYSDGVNVFGVLNPAGPQDFITYMFSDGLTVDVTLPDTLALIPGVDSIPQVNFVYIPQSTKTLTVSTTGWPAEEAKRLAYLQIRSAASTQTGGVHVN